MGKAIIFCLMFLFTAGSEPVATRSDQEEGVVEV